MHANWQDIAALTIVLAAVGYLAWQVRAVLAKKKSGGCGSCSSCPTDTTADGRQVVSLDSLKNGKRPSA